MADIQRPPYPHDRPQPGYQWVASVESDWRIARTPKQCRALRCPPGSRGGNRVCAPAVAEFDRGYIRNGVRHESWWAYCPKHMFGRWIDGDKVLGWVLRERQLSPERRAELLRSVTRG